MICGISALRLSVLALPVLAQFQNEELVVHAEKKPVRNTHRKANPGGMLQLYDRKPPYIDEAKFIMPQPAEVQAHFDSDTFTPAGNPYGCCSGRQQLNGGTANQKLETYMALVSQMSKQAFGMVTSIQAIRNGIQKLIRDTNIHEQNVANAMLVEADEGDEVEATVESMMEQWQHQTVNVKVGPTNENRRLAMMLPNIENGIERDNFMDEVKDAVDVSRDMFVTAFSAAPRDTANQKQIKNLEKQVERSDSQLGGSIGRTDSQMFGGQTEHYAVTLNHLMDKLDNGVGQQMNALDAMVNMIDAYLSSQSQSALADAKSLAEVVAPEVNAIMHSSVTEVRTIGREISKSKGAFLKEIEKIFKWINGIKVYNFKALDRYSTDLIKKTEAWKTVAERSTASNFKRFDKDLRASTKMFKKVAKAWTKRHKRDLKSAQKEVHRKLRKAANYIRRKAKVMRKEIKVFGSRARRIKRMVERDTQRVTESIKRVNATVDKTTERIRSWFSDLAAQKQGIEDGVQSQIVDLYRDTKQKGYAIVKAAKVHMRSNERHMSKALRKAQRSFLRKLRSQEDNIIVYWEGVSKEHEPIVQVAAELERAQERVAKDQGRAEMMISSSRRTLDLASKQARRSSDNYARKARDAGEKMLVKFKQGLVEDRPHFMKKLMGMRKEATAKSMDNLKSFSRWVVGQTASMGGTLEGVDETFKADNSGMIARRLTAELNGADSQVHVLKKRYRELADRWAHQTKRFHQDISAAISDAMQGATSLSTEADEHLSDVLNHAKNEAVAQLTARRKYADAATRALGEFADSKEKEWITRSGDQAKVTQSVASDLQQLERSAASFSEKANEKENDMREQVKILQRRADDRKVQSVAAAKELTSNSHKALESVVDDLLNTAEEKHVQAQSEASAKWAGLTATLPKKVDQLKSRLASMVAAQQERVSDVTREAKKLTNFADYLSGGGKNNAYQFLKGVDEITSAAAELYGTVKEGSTSQMAKAQLEQIKQLMADSMSSISENTRIEMEHLMAFMNDKIAGIMSNEELTETQRKAALETIQDETRAKLAQILSKDAEMTPLVEQYMSDVEYAHELEGRELSDDSDIAKAFGEERVLAARQNAETAKQERKYALQVVQRALREQDQNSDKAEDVLTAMNADDSRDAGLIGEATATLNEHAIGSLNEAHRTAVAAALKATKHTEFAKSILSREHSLMKDTKMFAEHEAHTLQMGVEGEQLKEAVGLLRLKDARKDFVNELSFMLEDAGNISTSMLKKRIRRLDQMEKEMNFSFQALQALGHEQFSNQVLKALRFGKSVLVSMVNMKLKMYTAMKMKGEASQTGVLAEQEFAALRQELLKQTMEREAKSSQLEAALRKKLEDMGAIGKISVEHLSAFLHQLSFELANGDQGGFEGVLGDLKRQFGFSIQVGDGVHAALGKAKAPLAMKLSASKDLLRGVDRKLQTVVKRFEAARGRILKHISKENQVSTLTTEELAERTRQLKALVGRLSVYHAPGHDPPSLVEAAKESRYLAARVTNLNKRVARDAKRRIAAVAEQQVLARSLQGNLRMSHGD